MKVVHFEIPADNMERARNFYKKVFGWKIEDAPGMDYALLGTTPTDERGMVTELGGINGGMAKRHDLHYGTVITIAVESIEAISKVIEREGGKIVRERMPVGDIGFAAYFVDSEGNVEGLWEPVMKR